MLIIITHKLRNRFSSAFCLGTFEIPVNFLLDPGSYGIRALNFERVKELEKSLIEKPPTDSMVLTAMIAPTCGDLTDFSKDTLLCYKFLVLSGNHRRAALQNILQTDGKKDCQVYKSVRVDVFRGKKFCFLFVSREKKIFI